MVALTAAWLSLLASSGLVAADGLNARAKAAGKKYFGTEVSTVVLRDSAANAIAKNSEDFGQVTCENEMKFDATEPSRGTFSYGNADAIVAQAAASGQIMRCHALVSQLLAECMTVVEKHQLTSSQIWHSQVPSWVTNGNFNNATLISILQNHIANVVGHFKGKCYAWDVVNEALNEDGSYRTSDSVWGRTIGATSFIPLAFKAAAAADPNARLYYNDYNIEKAGSKANGVLNLVRMVKAAGAPIHGVGLQGHFTTGQVGAASGLVSVLNSYAALGVEVAYTELDMRTPSSSPDFAQQAADLATVVSACRQVAACVGITTWGFTDKYTWISNSAPLIWDTNLQKKAAYNSILNAWGSGSGGGGGGGGGSPTTTSARPTTTSGSGGGGGGGGGSGCEVAKWGQCGGQGYTGCTVCASGSTCQVGNPYYSQCL
jgi:endo-1,4-beta-xylanase